MAWQNIPSLFGIIFYMSHELPATEPKETASERVDEALKLLDGYQSDRAKAGNKEFGDGKASHIIEFPNHDLTFFGSRHTNNPESATIADLRSDIRECLESVHPEELSFMIEGQHGTYTRQMALDSMRGIETVEDAVVAHGEKGVALWLVAQYENRNPPIHVEISSPEMPEEDIIENLTKDFKPDELATYLTIRQLTSFVGGHFKMDADRLGQFARTAYHLQQLTGVTWIKDFKSGAEIIELFKDEKAMKDYQKQIAIEFTDGLNEFMKTSGLIGYNLIPNIEEFISRDQPPSQTMTDINELHDPGDSANRQSVINRVSDRWNSERDKFLLKTIATTIDAGKKPFVIFGASHAINLEPALKKIME